MKKIFLTLVLQAFVTCVAFSQDMAKIQQDFEKQLKNTKAPYGHDSTKGKYYAVRGFKMYCEIYGEGQPLLIIHGNGGSINNFIYQIPYFAKTYKVIIADSRAQGKSADSGDSLSYEMMADDYAALLTALKIDSANVIGWSDGGINGLLLAIRHPEKVKKLAITGANLWPDTTGLTPFVFNDMIKNSAELRKKMQTPEVKNELKISDLDLYEPHMTLEQLHTIHCPTLVIGGDH